MTQTTGLTFTAAVVFCSPDGSTWTEMSGHGASVAQSGGDRNVGEQNTFDGVLPLIGAGDRKSTDVMVKFVYTETASEPFDVAQTAHESATGAFYVQYRPIAGGNWFKTGAGVIKSLLYPGGNADDGAIIMSEFVVTCAGLTDAAAST